ncbi:hypothetical protein ACFWP2_39540 [Kitasatospora sp. NPDC058444]|uniref:hypothetical protein n=1 Tax=Kitasatospora sp. NPDC058444 TaxID=3346504 RepID=UPI00365579F3
MIGRSQQVEKTRLQQELDREMRVVEAMDTADKNGCEMARITEQTRSRNEHAIRSAMDRLLRGEVPEGGRCDLKTPAAEAGVTRTAFSPKKGPDDTIRPGPYRHLVAEFTHRLKAMQATGETQPCARASPRCERATGIPVPQPAPSFHRPPTITAPPYHTARECHESGSYKIFVAGDRFNLPVVSPGWR